MGLSWWRSGKSCGGEFQIGNLKFQIVRQGEGQDMRNRNQGLARGGSASGIAARRSETPGLPAWAKLCCAPTALGEDDKLQMVDLKLKVAKMPILRRVPFAFAWNQLTADPARAIHSGS